MIAVAVGEQDQVGARQAGEPGCRVAGIDIDRLAGPAQDQGSVIDRMKDDVPALVTR